MGDWAALYYSVVVTPSRRLTTADLLSIAAITALENPRTALATGNLLFGSSLGQAELETRLETVSEAQLGRRIPVFCRERSDLRALLADNPFANETRDNPANVAVRVMRRMPDAEVIDRIAKTVGPGEKFHATALGLWIAIPSGMSSSRLLSAVGGKAVGEGTFRNASSLAKITKALG
jgi:uncharacterized protein (DUF1697 family)